MRDYPVSYDVATKHDRGEGIVEIVNTIHRPGSKAFSHAVSVMERERGYEVGSFVYWVNHRQWGARVPLKRWER